MAKELERQTVREFGNRKKSYRKIRTIFIIVLLLAIVVIGFIYFKKVINRTYQNYEVMNTSENVGTAKANYIGYGSAVVKYNRDGAVAIGRNGKLIWNGSFEMKDPIAATCEGYVAIADRGNKLIHIFNEKGAVGNFSTLYNIIKIEVAKQGVVAVLMEDGDYNYITLFDEEGEKLTGGQTYTNKNGFPMDMALSKDGTKLVTSYLKVTTGVIESTVAFYNFGEVGKNKSERLMGGYEYSDVIIPRVTFLDNNTVGVYKDNGFMLYSYREIPKLIHEEEIEQNISSIIHGEKYIGVVLKNETENNEYQINLYNLEGKQVLNQNINFDYDKIFISEEEIILHNNLDCIILKTNGKEKFRSTFDSNIAAFQPINNLDRYLLVGETVISEIMLVE